MFKKNDFSFRYLGDKFKQDCLLFECSQCSVKYVLYSVYTLTGILIVLGRTLVTCKQTVTH